MAYETTKVAVDSSQSDLRKLLKLYGAEGYQFGEMTRDGTAWASIEFVHEGYVVRMRVPHKTPSSAELRGKAKRARTKTLDDLTEEKEVEFCRLTLRSA